MINTTQYYSPAIREKKFDPIWKIKKGYWTNFKTFSGETSVHIVIVNGDLYSLKLLIGRCGADVNARAQGRFFMPEDCKDKMKQVTDYEGKCHRITSFQISHSTSSTHLKRLQNSRRKGNCASSRMVTLHSIPGIIQEITPNFS